MVLIAPLLQTQVFIAKKVPSHNIPVKEMSEMKVLSDHLGSSFVVHVLSDGLELAVGLRIISEDVEGLDISGGKKTFFILHG